METPTAVTAIVIVCILAVLALTAPLWIGLVVLIYAVLTQTF